MKDINRQSTTTTTQLKIQTESKMEIVKIKPEWCDHPSEETTLFKIVEDNGDRVVIKPITGECSKWVIVPTQLVKRDMLITQD